MMAPLFKEGAKRPHLVSLHHMTRNRKVSSSSKQATARLNLLQERVDRLQVRNCRVRMSVRVRTSEGEPGSEHKCEQHEREGDLGEEEECCNDDSDGNEAEHGLARSVEPVSVVGAGCVN